MCGSTVKFKGPLMETTTGVQLKVDIDAQETVHLGICSSDGDDEAYWVLSGPAKRGQVYDCFRPGWHAQMLGCCPEPGDLVQMVLGSADRCLRYNVHSKGEWCGWKIATGPLPDSVHVYVLPGVKGAISNIAFFEVD
jgi:hypothetical protein